MKYIFCLLLGVCFVVSAVGQQVDYLKAFEQAVPEKPAKELQFLAFFYTHAARNNYFPTNDFLRGQVIGRLFGPNTSTTNDTVSTNYFEQRVLPFFIYQPKLFNGKALLRASFEIDWTWGDVAYGTGGNFGSAFSADQVNLQTQNLELELLPAKGWAVNLGLQRLYDTPHHPYRTFFNKFTSTGYRLMYWGSDAVGVSVRRDWDFAKFKGGYYQLYENRIQADDDVALLEATYQHNISMAWNVGGSLYYVRDRSNGAGGPSILGQGLNSTLVNYNGAYRFPMGGNRYEADVYWLGAYFSHNEDFMLNRWLLTGFVNANVGTVRQLTDNGFTLTHTLAGLGANVRLGYRYGQTLEDAVVLDVLYTSGDGDGLADGRYSGVMTGNTWGTPGGLYISHGAYILFPHGNVVNRYMGAVSDISNQGYGISAATLNVSRAFVPHKLDAKLGGAFGYSNVAPPQGGQLVGVEVNGKAAYHFGPFMSAELHGAYLFLGDFYDSMQMNGGVAERPTNPWTAFLLFKWLLF